MPTRLKLATFNVEWMVNLFHKDRAQFWSGPSKSSGLGRKPPDVPAVCRNLAGVVRAVAPDVLGIQEGPPRRDQMQLFVKEFLNDEYTVYTVPAGRQSVHVLARTDLPIAIEQVPETDDMYRHLARQLSYYTWGDVREATRFRFTRLPVVMRLIRGDQRVEVMVLHTKSKISRLKHPRDWEERDRAKILDALRSRQRLSAEIAAVRRYLTHAVYSQRAEACIVMGDLNDGPNRDVFEEEFLIHSIVDELRGGFTRESALMHHALPELYLNSLIAYTAEFRDPTEAGARVRALLDHVLVSSRLLFGKAFLQLDWESGKVEHEAYDENTTGPGTPDRPSDHRPVSVEFIL